jgi:hypothetical protein
MKIGITKHSAFAGALIGVFIGLLPASVLVQKKAERSSPPYTVVVALETTSPFVGDGRMTFADFAFSTTFKDVVFVFDPADQLEFCSVEAEEGKLFLTRHEFNDVQEGDDRHRPWVKKEWPKEFPASLSVSPEEVFENAPADKDGLTPVPLVPPKKVKLRFRAEFGLVDLSWFSKLGSNALSEMSFDFDVPWLELLGGKALTLKLPYESTEPEEKGEWWIEFIPKKKG